MALDVQRNWDVSMAENLQSIKLQARERTQKSTLSAADDPKTHQIDHLRRPSRPTVYLPDEIILQILDHVQRNAKTQQTLYSCTLLSHQWFDAAVPLLYAHPILYGWNYDPFTRAICPSINLHVRKSPLSELVKVLDMSGLVHQGSKSITARLLGRTKDNLEVFVAPQASFAINCFPALAKCKRLRQLDLSLVTEIASLQILFKTVRGLHNLKELRLPRGSGFGAKPNADDIVWPPTLERLFLSGAIDAHFLYGVVKLPTTLRELAIEHCPLAKGHAVRQFLETISREGIHLKYLKLSHLPQLADTALDYVLTLLPSLQILSISVDYISPNLIDQEWNDLAPGTLRIRTLELTNSGNPGAEDKLSPLDIMIAMEEGSLSDLREVRVAKSLGWHHSSTAGELDALNDALELAGSNDPPEVAGKVKPRPGAWAFDD